MTNTRPFPSRGVARDPGKPERREDGIRGSELAVRPSFVRPVGPARPATIGSKRFFAKRAFDIFAGIIALLVLSPVLVITALLVRWRLGSPVLFTQVRPGIHGQPFRIYKFRTMTLERDSEGNLLPDELRMTRLGRFLRSSSLDELPELLNVLQGNMSLVGPRPLIMDYLPRYSPQQARRHEVLPGITGWAQVNGRNAISWQGRFELDVWYVDHRSIWLDLKILWLTIVRVVRRDGISADGHATMPSFHGDSFHGDTERT